MKHKKIKRKTQLKEAVVLFICVAECVVLYV